MTDLTVKVKPIITRTLKSKDMYIIHMLSYTPKLYFFVQADFLYTVIYSTAEWQCKERLWIVVE